MKISWENIDELEDYYITYLLHKESLNVNQIARIRNISVQEVADHLIEVQKDKREEDRKKDEIEVYLTLNKEERLNYLSSIDSDEIVYFKRKVLRRITFEKDIRSLMILTWTAGELRDEIFLEFLEGLNSHENPEVRKVAYYAVKKIKNKFNNTNLESVKKENKEPNKKVNIYEKKIKKYEENEDIIEYFLALDKNERLDFLDRLKSEKMLYFKKEVYKRILEEKNPGDLVILIWAIGEMKDEKYLRFLHDLTKHWHSDVRRITYSAIRKIGSPKSRKVLEVGLSDSNAQTRQYCAKALLKVGNKNSLDILRDLYRSKQGVEKDYVLRSYREAIIELEKSV